MCTYQLCENFTFFMQRRMVMKQHAEVMRQVRALVQIMQRQIMLVGKDPLAEDADQQQQAEVVAIVAPPEENPGRLKTVLVSTMLLEVMVIIAQAGQGQG